MSKAKPKPCHQTMDLFAPPPKEKAELPMNGRFPGESNGPSNAQREANRKWAKDLIARGG